MESLYSNDEEYGGEESESVLDLLGLNDEPSSTKVHFQVSEENDDVDDHNLKLRSLSKQQHKSSHLVIPEETTATHDEEHTSMPAVVAASITPSATRSPPPLPNPLTPTTRVVKRPASQRASNRRPGAYSIDGMDASTDGNRSDDFDEYDSVAPAATTTRSFRSSWTQLLRSSRVIRNGNGGQQSEDEAPTPIACDDKQVSSSCSSRKMAAVVLVVLVVIGVVVGVTLGVRGSSSSSSTSSSSTSTSGAGGNCDFSGQVQPNILRQCQCSGKVRIISTAISQSYQSLLTSLVPAVIPHFQDASDSCSPANQALLWLANDTTLESSSSTRLTNRFVLMLLYVAWGGSEWRHNEGWASSTDECSWYGIACQQQVVSKLSLCNNSVAMNSSMPTELFALTGIVSLTLAGNSLVGTLPSLISKLSKLEYINIANNQLMSSFPFNELAALTNLAGIDFSYNVFSGTIPSTVAQLRKLESLIGSYNLLGGFVPTELALATKLVTFDVNYNAFTGTIPSELGMLTNLELFTIGGPLSGTVPTELGRLVKLRVLAITSQLSMVGHIPTQLSLLSQLETLALPGNHLSGSIPSALSKCVSLVSLNLQHNDFTGTIPTELGLIESLEIFDASYNKLNGNIPGELFRRPLHILNLANNHFNGSLPLNVGNASQLKCLDVTSNNLVEISPTSVCQQVGLSLQTAAVDCPAQQAPNQNSNNSTFSVVDGCPCCNCHGACSTSEKQVALHTYDTCFSFQNMTT